MGRERREMKKQRGRHRGGGGRGGGGGSGPLLPNGGGGSGFLHPPICDAGAVRVRGGLTDRGEREGERDMENEMEREKDDSAFYHAIRYPLLMYCNIMVFGL